MSAHRAKAVDTHVDAPAEIAWFCLRSQPKHERVAAGHLQQMEDVEVFNPRIRYARSTRHGPVWVIESLFPNYLFARFNWRTLLNTVHYAPGVAGIVHFGCRWPTVPDKIIEDVRALVGPDELHDPVRELSPGDKVRISGGALHGLEAVITQVMPGQQRVQVLLDFLGRQTAVDIGANTITKHIYR